MVSSPDAAFASAGQDPLRSAEHRRAEPIDACDRAALLGPVQQLERAVHIKIEMDSGFRRNDGKTRVRYRTRFAAHAASCSRPIFALCRMSTGNRRWNRNCCTRAVCTWRRP